MIAIEESRQKEITAKLSELEAEQNIAIIHAVESGSRAWGFPSKDSDYDVRVIYHHPKVWYITAFEKKDNFELPIDSLLDIGGWDVAKCMRLLHKGNAVIHEWLKSPLIYRSKLPQYDLLAGLAEQVFNPAAAFHHYYSMAKKRFADNEPPGTAKSFLYGMRALLSASWIAEHQTAPSIVFEDLLNTQFDHTLRELIDQLLIDKTQAAEKDTFHLNAQLLKYCREKTETLSQLSLTYSKTVRTTAYDEVLNALLSQGGQ